MGGELATAGKGGGGAVCVCIAMEGEGPKLKTKSINANCQRPSGGRRTVELAVSLPNCKIPCGTDSLT